MNTPPDNDLQLFADQLTPEQASLMIQVLQRKAAPPSLQERIRHIRSTAVMIDRDLAELYGVSTKQLNQAVGRNPERFPPKRMFRLTDDEARSLRSQNATLETAENLRSQNVTSSWGGRRHLPYAFTESGVVMAATVLRSDAAHEACAEIVDGFVAYRGLMRAAVPVPTIQSHRLSGGLFAVMEFIRSECITAEVAEPFNMAQWRLEVAVRDLYDRYVAWSHDHRVEPRTLIGFGKLLRQVVPVVEKVYMGGRNNRQWAYIGVALKEPLALPASYSI